MWPHTETAHRGTARGRGSHAIAARRDQRGSVSTELVVVTPVLLLLVMLVVQFALWQHAQHIAQAAAQRGAETARVEGGSDAEGRVMTQAALAQLGGDLLSQPAVTIAQRRHRHRGCDR
jgi:Flp pilus assembly protein TadG